MTLRDLVFAALDNAKANGYELEATDEDVAINLLDYDAEIWMSSRCMPDVMDLIPHIEQWRKQHA